MDLRASVYFLVAVGAAAVAPAGPVNEVCFSILLITEDTDG